MHIMSFYWKLLVGVIYILVITADKFWGGNDELKCELQVKKNNQNNNNDI